MSTEDSLESLTVEQLKSLLEERGLPKSGKKAELIEIAKEIGVSTSGTKSDLVAAILSA